MSIAFACANIPRAELHDRKCEFTHCWRSKVIAYKDGNPLNNMHENIQAVGYLPARNHLAAQACFQETNTDLQVLTRRDIQNIRRSAAVTDIDVNRRKKFILAAFVLQQNDARSI
jgi:hypothetical protein